MAMQERDFVNRGLYLPEYGIVDPEQGNSQRLQEQYNQFLQDLPYRAEIEQHIDPFLTPDQTPMSLGSSTAAILFNMRRFQPEVYGHSQSVGDLAAAIAQEVGFELPIHEVKVAGDLHDIWKVKMRALTDHRGPFSDEQREQYHQHPSMGAALLHAWGYPINIVDGARFHHCGIRYPLEAPNYPNVPNSLVPRMGKIINLADYSIAARTARSYKVVVPMDELFARLDQALAMGSTDADLVAGFKSAVERYGEPWMRHSIHEDLAA